MAGKTTWVLAALLGGAGGYVGARLGAPEIPPDPLLEVAALTARVSALEAGRGGAPGLKGEARASLAGTPPANAAGSEVLERNLIEVLRTPSPELRALLAAAPEAEGDETTAGKVGMGAPDSGKGAGASLGKQIEGVDARIDSAAETYGLHRTQVDALKELTRRALAETAEARAAGASKEALRGLEVGIQGQVRQIVGEDTYVAIERDRVTREARGQLTWLAAAVGLTETQHQELDRILAGGVERALADVVRVRTEPLSTEAYREAQERLAAGRAADWDRIRNELLTAEQRARIPGK